MKKALGLELIPGQLSVCASSQTRSAYADSRRSGDRRCAAVTRTLKLRIADGVL